MVALYSILCAIYLANINNSCYVLSQDTFRGQVLNNNQLWDLIEGLQENDLIHYTHLLTSECVKSFF